MIRTNYDPEADVPDVAFDQAGARPDTSEEAAPGVFVEFNPIGIEVISVRRKSDERVATQAAAK